MVTFVATEREEETGGSYMAWRLVIFDLQQILTNPM
jgi:hypothetical protein